MTGIALAYGANQAPGIGMFGICKKGGGGCDLHHLPQIQNHDSVADELHNPQVMTDEQIGQREFLLQFLEQIDDLRLH
ncbi:hypothetical protein SDC9_146740 [bioreactor metagenome]|uniref:Uncharacterized protein n=1 Tax=bioreactor metagenome TaxID=1076179 RepID=A0A645EEJ4_9ZZZZ